MRLVLISDTHSLHSKIKLPPGDVLIHAGDFMNSGRDTSEIIRFNTWLGKQPHRYKLINCGNHDIYCQQQPMLAKQLLSNGTLLIDEAVTIEGKRFYFTPWTPNFGNWAFMTDEQELVNKYSRIPKDLDVVVSHGPMRGIIDLLESNVPAGSQALKIAMLDARPKTFISGHIHCAYGRTKLFAGIQCYGVSSCTERYECVNEPIVIDI